MPLYEYECGDCGRRFEHLSRADDRPACPACRGENLSRLLSVFAVSSRAGAQPDFGGACTTCGDPRGPGSCSMN